MRHGGNIFSVAEREGVPWQQVLDFSASINPLGPSEAAREAILAAMDRIVHYPERMASSLCEQLALEWGVKPGQVIAGNGATELLFDWCRYFGTGTIAAPAFGEFHRAWPAARLCSLADVTTWPADGPLVLTRPANPTGTLVAAEQVLRYARGRVDAVLVDESFLDFCAAESLTNHAGGNLFVLRSLTKFWALPGLRIGALVGDVEALARLRPPWPVNALAEAAALASIKDREHAARTRAFVHSESAWMVDQLQAIPELRVWEPAANYLFLETERAAELTALAAARRLLLRDCTGWPGFTVSGVRVAVRKRWGKRDSDWCLQGVSMRLILLLLLGLLTAFAAPQRIVSTAPSFTETLFAIGAGDRVVAVSTYCHFPEAANKLPRVGSYLQPNVEAIARLRPDLVLVHTEQKATLTQLAGLGIKTLALKNTNLEETLQSAVLIGDAVGRASEGKTLEAKIRTKLATIEKRSAGKAPRTLLFIVGRTPGRLDGMIAVGKGSFLNEVIRIAGGKNVLFDSPVTYPKISLEAILRLAPDVIVDMGDMAETTGVTEEHKRSVVKLWESQQAVRAVTKRKVFAVAADIFVVPGPRVTEAAEAFAAMLQ